MTPVAIVTTHRTSHVTPPGHWRWAAKDAALVRHRAALIVGRNLLQFTGLRMSGSKVGILFAAVPRATVIATESAIVDLARWR
jgi:hypothetical protein